MMGPALDGAGLFSFSWSFFDEIGTKMFDQKAKISQVKLKRNTKQVKIEVSRRLLKHGQIRNQKSDPH